MQTSISKRLLAGLLSVVMVLSLMAMAPVAGNNAEAATKPSITGAGSINVGDVEAYKIKNLKKTQYAKISVTGEAAEDVTVLINGTVNALGKKILGTGKDRTLKVSVDESAAGKTFTLQMKIYGRKTGKLVYKTAAKCPVEVASVAATAITLDQTAITLKEGTTATVAATLTPANSTAKVEWTSADATVATVANGVITAVKAGKTTVTAKTGALTATVEVTVEGNTATAITAAVVGTKKIEVTFNGAVDTKKAVFAIKRDGKAIINVDSVKWNDNKATLTTIANLLKGEYEVTVTGVGEKALVANMTVDKDPYVAKIEVLSSVAPMKAMPSEYARVRFAVYNQYGEVMTKDADVTWMTSLGTDIYTATGTKIPGNKIGVTAKLGYGEFYVKASTAAFVPKTVVKLNGLFVDGTTGVSAQCQAEVTVDMPEKLEKVTIEGLFDEDLEAVEYLPANFEDDAYYVVAQGYTQYGDAYTNYATLSVLSTNQTLVKTGAVTPYDGMALIPLSKGDLAGNGGKADIQFVCTESGNRELFNVEVKEAAKLAKFTLIKPADLIAAYDAPVEIEFEAYDQFGTAITKYSVLSAYIGKGLTINGATLRSDAKGKAHLTFVPGAKNPYVTVSASVGAYYSSIQFAVVDQAVPTSIIDVDTDKMICKGNNIEIGGFDVVVIDQYGREMDEDQMNDFYTAGGYIKVEATNAADPFDVSGNSLDSAKVVKLFTNPVATKASVKLTYTIVDAVKGAQEDSAKSVTYSVVNYANFVDFEVAQLPLIYDQHCVSPETLNPKFNTKVTVFGVLKDGTKVSVPYSNDWYTLEMAGIAGCSFADGTIVQTGTEMWPAAKYKTGNAKGNLRVTIIDQVSKAARKVVMQSVEFSMNDPEVTTYKFNAKVASEEGKNYISIQPKATLTAGDLQAAAFKALVDQYGKSITENAKVTITSTKFAKKTTTVSANGTTLASIIGANTNDTFVAVFEFESGLTVEVEFTIEYALV